MILNHHINYSRVSLIFTAIFFFLSISLNGITYVSKKSGNWSNNGTWIPSGVPGAGDDVQIANGHKVRINGDFACNSLTVGTSAITMSTLEFRGGAHTFTVFGNAIINAGDTLDIKANSNTTHTVSFYGNVTNNGGIQLFPDANSMCIAIFKKNGNQMISGTGSFSKFYKMILNMGSSSNNILDISVSNFTAPINFLTLINGTLKISTTNVQNITTFTAATTIPSTAGLWLNSFNLTVNTFSTVTNSGSVIVSSGTLNIGSTINQDFLYSGGSCSLAAGQINISGNYSGAGNTNLSITGGSMNVANLSSIDIANAPFQINNSTSTFNMSGGIIVVNREGGTGAQDLGYINLSTTGSVTGGTIQIGSSFAAVGSTLNINSAASIGNLLVTGPNVTAKLNTNTVNIIKDVTINSGILNANNLGITLGGNWQNNGGTFTAGTSTVTFNSNSAQSLFKSGGETFNHLGFSGTGSKTFSSAVSCANFSISASSQVDVSTTNHQLTVRGNFINSGTFAAQNGLVFFNGTTAQTIGGSSTTNFFNLTLANPTGMTLTNAENLIGTLTLSGGNFNTNLQMFTMVSTATATARIAQLTGTGDINGPVRVQRFVPGGTTGWALWGTPISSALSFADWDDNIAISCPTCPDGYVPNFPSIYSYSEAAVGTYSDYLAYIPISTINDPIISNTGYWVYVGDGPTTTSGITVDVIGTVRKGNQAIPLGYTNYGSPVDDGWNLIHNPYPSPISWTSLKGATSNIDNAIYVYNADLNGGAGGSATYVNGVSSPAVGSGGIGDNIPMSQGFYVHSTGATQINATEANKVASTQAFLRETSSQQSVQQIVRVNMSSNNSYNFSDEVVVYTQAGASTNFDNDFDAIKMAGQDPYAPYIEIEEGNSLMQVNAIAPLVGTHTTSLKALTGYPGTYTISLSEFTFPIGACVSLFDKFTNTTTDIIASNYVFNLSDTTTVARFVLSITLNQLQITSNVIQPSCLANNGGEISVIGNNTGPWNYYWKDASGNPIKTTLNKPVADSLIGLSNGSYQLDITTVGGCDNNNSNYAILPKQLPYSAFNCLDTCFININPNVVFNNITANAVSQTWYFGDSNTSTDVYPYNQYTSVGNYLVRLISNSSTGCTDSASKILVVVNKAVSIKINTLNAGLKVHTLSNNHYLLQQELATTGNLSYILRDAQAKQVLVQSKHFVDRVYIDLDLSKLEFGIYFLSLQLDDKSSVIKLVVTK